MSTNPGRAPVAWPGPSFPGVIVPLPTVSADLFAARPTLLTTAEAADHLGVKPVTIRQWVNRDHLKPVGRLPAGGSLVFDMLDLAKAEAATREKARRPSPRQRSIARLRALSA